MTPAQQLIDEIRRLQAEAAGKQLELSMLLGEREQAQKWLEEMNAQTLARLAWRQTIAEAV